MERNCTNCAKLLPYTDFLAKTGRVLKMCCSCRNGAVAYAITVHKSQGLTLNHAILNITDKDFSPGLTYVAVSRVKKLSDIMFEESFDYDRFKPSNRSSIITARNEDAERRRAQHIQDPLLVTPSRSYSVRTQSTPPSPLISARTHGAAQLLSTASSAISSLKNSLRHSSLGQIVT
jgi:hypothetical protein